VPLDGTPESLVGIEPPPRQTIRFVPEGEPVLNRSPPEGYRPSEPEVSQRG
jgi:hypothetical protein